MSTPSCSRSWASIIRWWLEVLERAVTPNSRWSKVKLAHEGLKARLALSKNPLLTRRSYSDYALSEPAHYSIVDFNLPARSGHAILLRSRD